MTYDKNNIEFIPKPTNGRFLDIEGQTFGRLTVLGYAPAPRAGTFWFCECECGTIVRIHSQDLRTGHTKSCGCLLQELRPSFRRTHGASKTPEYEVWCGMLKRCNNPNAKQFKDWGGRGIKVCEHWTKFENFLADMGKRPSPKHTIDRINNDGNYEPTNCEWVPSLVDQAAHTRRSKMITYEGKTQSLPVWCRELHLSYDAVKRRLLLGWTTTRAFTAPLRKW